MITERIVSRLENLVAKYAFRDWWAANRNNRKRWYSSPYSLSCDTNEAREMLRLAQKRKKITLDEEAQLKTYMVIKIQSGEMDDIIRAETAGQKYDPSKNFRR